MSATYHGQHSGIVLTSGFAAKNPVTIATDGTITSGAGYNGDAVYGNNYPWTIDNLGTIDATGTASAGVDLRAGGEVVNGSLSDTTALIEGGGSPFTPGGGIVIAGGAGSVVNYGTIEGPGPGSVGINLANGGTVRNYGVVDEQVEIGGPGGAVGNYDVITGVSIAAAGIIGNFGSIGAADADIVVNEASGWITTAIANVLINYGRIFDASARDAGQTLTNFGSIGYASFISPFQDALVTNFGTIYSLITDGLVNEASGLIQNGVASRGTVINYGTIGFVRPFGSSLYDSAVAQAYSVKNAGLIDGGIGVPRVYNAPHTITNTGIIEAFGTNGSGVRLGTNGLIANYGGGPGGGLITGTEFGVSAGTSDTIVSSGTIEGGQAGIEAWSITVTNTGLIEGGQDGIKTNGPGGIVDNFGSIEATGSAGVGISLGGVGNTGYLQQVTNELGGYILGGVAATSVATVINYGTIVHPTGAGILLSAGGTVIDAGLVSGGGGGLGIFLGGSGPNLLVLEPGYTIVGGAYAAAGASNTLELAAGAGPGSAYLGSNFQGFGTVRVDPGASWYLSGSGPRFFNDGTIIDAGYLLLGPIRSDLGNRGWTEVGGGNTVEFGGAAGATQRLAFTDAAGTARLDHPRNFHALIEGFTEGDVIDLIGKSVDGLSYANHQLVLTEGGHFVADLHFAGHYTASQFALSPDGSGGTYLTLTGAMAATDSWKMKS